MNSERIKEIQETTAYPESVSVFIALEQVWNECEQQDNWISVGDRLPELNKIVQTWRRGLLNGKMVSVGDTNLWHYEGESRYTYEVPTHWQPLPTVPIK